MKTFEKIFPWAIVGVGVFYLVFFFVPRGDKADDFAYEAFARLPVTDNGRLKPMDTVARINLKIISGGRETWTYEEERGKDDVYTEMRPAIRWLLDTMSGRFVYETTMLEGIRQKALPIRDEALLDQLTVKRSPDGLYSIADLLRAPAGASDQLLLERTYQLMSELKSAADRIDVRKAGGRDRAIVSLKQDMDEHWSKWNRTALLRTPAAKHKVFRVDSEEVLSLLGLQPRPRLRYALSEFGPRLKEFYDVYAVAHEKPEDARDHYDTKVIEVGDRIERYVLLSTGRKPAAIPPLKDGQPWIDFAQVRVLGLNDKLSLTYTALLHAYAANKVPDFNEALTKYTAEVEQTAPDAFGTVGFEASFNEASPFFHAQHLYMLVFLFGCLSWLGWSEPFRKAGLYLAVLTLAVHTLSLLARMYIMQRPFVFVTNLYSSAVFIGWGAVLFGVILDFIFKNGIGVAAAGVIGYSTLLIAGFLSLSSDTLDPLQAVLDTNFWLATHVTTVTFGYTATFFAGVIGIAFILLGVLTPSITTEGAQLVNKMLYGVVCFGMLFSFVGTVLGGIWADQSWGRFWGWDPKENGALLIVLWNALILHARWGGLVKLRGMAVLAVLGNIVTAWSWFGTNMLPVGLHSYGRMDGAVTVMLAVIIGHLVIAGVGLIPLDHWWSFHRSQRPTPPPDDNGGARLEPRLTTSGAAS